MQSSKQTFSISKLLLNFANLSMFGQFGGFWLICRLLTVYLTDCQKRWQVGKTNPVAAQIKLVFCVQLIRRGLRHNSYTCTRYPHGRTEATFLEEKRMGENLIFITKKSVLLTNVNFKNYLKIAKK